MPDDVYWRSTIEEVNALVDKLAERQEARGRAAALRAGLVTAAIYNVHRKEGTPAFSPTDFVRTPPKTLTPEQAEAVMDAWAGNVNRDSD